MKDRKISYLYFYFMCYACFGWLYETFFQVVVYGRDFLNRGVLSGPYLPVYGFGALICLLLLSDLKYKKFKIKGVNFSPTLVFIGAMIIGTIVELITSYILEYSIGKWLWNYNRFLINFQGRIALIPSVLFGMGGLFFLYLSQPIFEKIADKLGRKYVKVISAILFVIVIADLILKIKYCKYS